tara:strand:- start:631 stop:894 length:264 start_codon:yes stop_codon:yes gene_type:complete
MSHALQGEINYIVEILEDHTFGDNIIIPSLRNEHYDKQIIEGGNMMTYLDHNTKKFICEDSLEELLYRLPKEVIRQLHEITLREYAL